MSVVLRYLSSMRDKVMKIGIIYEGDEIMRTLHYDFIAETFANRESWSQLYLTQRIKLEKHGYNEERFKNEFQPLIQKAKKWMFYAPPQKVLLTIEDEIGWRELLRVTEIITH